MKILFVSSGNSKNGISSIIKNQGDSLKNLADVQYFTIQGKGIVGYLKAIPTLRKHLKNNKYDIVHAHYSLSAFVASLAFAKPLVVSLMGSDVNAKGINRIIVKFFHFLFWDKTIVKSEGMKKKLNLKNIVVIPNGVDFKKYNAIERDFALDKVKWDKKKRHVLFAANPNRIEKNYQLAKAGFDLLNNPNVELHYLENVANEMMPYYFNASDVIMLTSLWEGSPNVIKEAMACNIPIVSTDVGDVKNLISNTEGCYIAENNPKNVADKIQRALDFNNKTNGRNNIVYLNSDFIANKIVKLYNSALNKS